MDLKRKMVEAPCPHCDTSLILRLPKGEEDGTFSVECQDCSRVIEIDIEITPNGKERIRLNGRIYRPPRKIEPERIKIETEKKPAVVIEDIREGPNYARRTKIAFTLLVVVGVLGIIASLVTVSSSFTIKDLEEQSPNDRATFSVWVIDSDNGRSIEGVQVSIRSGSYNESSVTDQDGLVVMNGVRTGEMEIELKHPNYKSTKGEVVISKGSPNVIDVPMESGDPSIINPLPLTQLRSPKYTPGLTNIAAMVMFLSSMMAILSAFFVRAREFFSLAVLAAFLSLFSFGFLIGTLLALVALVLVINSYGGFSHHYQLKMILEQEGREDLKRFFREQGKPILGLPPHENGETESRD